MTGRAVALAIGAAVAGIASIAVWTTDRDSGSTGAADVATTVGPPVDGASLFLAKGCASCHTGPDSTAFQPGFPNLRDAASWAGQRVPGMTAEDYIAQSIRDPLAVISPQFTGGIGPTTGMPALALSDAEVAALVDYLLAP